MSGQTHHERRLLADLDVIRGLVGDVASAVREQIDEAVRHLIWSYECGHSLQQGTMVALLWLREVANHYQLAVKQGDEEQAKYLHSVLEACQRIVTRVQ